VSEAFTRSGAFARSSASQRFRFSLRAVELYDPEAGFLLFGTHCRALLFPNLPDKKAD
jgi:hypothetical protein